MSDEVVTIPLEKPASVRKLVPNAAGNGWLLPDYYVGDENRQLEYLFRTETVTTLDQAGPIVLYGDEGTGKTALAITLAVIWSRTLSRRPLAFNTGSGFVRDFTASIEIDDTKSFRSRYRDCELLVIDDLDALSSAPAAQAEFAITVDFLLDAGRPVVLTSKRLPANLDGISSALASRLSGGLSVPLNHPRGLTISRVTAAFCERQEPLLPVTEVQEIVQLFASQTLSAKDINTIVMMCAQNISEAGQLKRQLIIDLARAHLLSAEPTVPEIAKIVARKMGVRITEMRGATREANIVRARGLAILLSRQLTATSLQQIGQFFGGRDHSTVLHAYRKTEKTLDDDNELATLKRDVELELNIIGSG